MWNPNITPKYIEAWYIFSKCPLKLRWYEILNSIYWASKVEITVILFSEIELNNPEKVPRLKIVIWGQKQVFWDYICASVRKMG